MFSGGTIFNYVNRQLASAVLLVCLGTGTALTPFIPSLPLFLAIGGFIGFGWGGYDTAQIVWIIEMWGKDGAAFIQAQHFSYAFGAFVSPLIVKSFLPADSNESLLEPDQKPNSTVLQDSSLTAPETSAPNFHVPFLISGTLSISAALILVLFYIVKKYEKPMDARHPTKHEMETEAAKLKASSLRQGRRILLIVLSALFLGVAQGMEGISFQFLPTFAHLIDLRLSQRAGALLLSGLGGAFTLGRGLGIFVVLKVPAVTLLSLDLLTVLTGNCILVLWANNSLTALLTGSLLVGFGLATIYATYFAYIEAHVAVENRVGAFLVAGGGLISGLYPLVVGSFIESAPFMLTYASFFSLIVGSLLFFIISQLVPKSTQDEDRLCLIPMLGSSDERFSPTHESPNA